MKKRTRLAVLLEELQMSQRTLAKRAGLSLPWVKKMAQGAKRISNNASMAISAAIGVHAAWLRGEWKTRPIMGIYGFVTKETAEEVHRRKYYAREIEREADELARDFAITMERVAKLFVDAHGKKWSCLAMDRVKMALDEIDHALKINSLDPQRTSEIIRKVGFRYGNEPSEIQKLNYTKSKPYFGDVAKGIAERFYSALKASCETRPDF